MNYDLSELLPFWDKLTNHEKQKCQQAVTYHEFKKGEIISGTGKNCTGIFIVLKGQMRAFITSVSGREITLYRLLERDICLFSASCLLKDLNTTINITTMQETSAILIPVNLYKTLSQTSLAVSDFTSRLMAQSLQDILWIMEQVLFTSLDKRLAAFLLEQAAIDGTNLITITHDEISRHLGSAREVITRMLKYFQGEGYVALSRGGIEILNEKALSELV